MKTFKKLIFLLSTKERKRALLLLIMIIIMAIIDVIGVASILPFMTVLTNPGLIETNLILNSLFKNLSVFGVETSQQFIFALGILVFLLLVTSLAFKAFTTYLQGHFVQMREYSIGKRLVEGYLNQPYSWFLSRHSSDLGKTILSEVSQIIANGIRPFIELIAKSIITITLICLIILINFKLSIIVALSLGVVYLVIFYFVQNYLRQSGQKD